MLMTWRLVSVSDSIIRLGLVISNYVEQVPSSTNRMLAMYAE
jgi:hypothetical protein